MVEKNHDNDEGLPMGWAFMLCGGLVLRANGHRLWARKNKKKDTQMKKALMMMAVMSASALVPAAYAGQGSLLIAPTRLVIEPGQRSGEAGITNVSTKHLRYKISLADQVMTASGSTVISDTFDYSAKDMLRFMPKVVDLQPGARQTIRVMVMRPDDLPDGDYHTHMMFDELVSAPPSPTDVSDTAIERKGMRADVEVSYSMGIPVIVENGKLTGSITLVSAEMARNADGKTIGVRARFHREGNSEGSVKVTGENNGKQVLTVRNMRMYREANDVEVVLPFTDAAMPEHVEEVTLRLFPMDAGKNTPEISRLQVK